MNKFYITYREQSEDSVEENNNLFANRIIIVYNYSKYFKEKTTENTIKIL